MNDDYLNSEIEHAIDEKIHSKRNREILKRRYIDGDGLEELAESYHLSVSQIKNILYEGKLKIF